MEYLVGEQFEAKFNRYASRLAIVESARDTSTTNYVHDGIDRCLYFISHPNLPSSRTIKGLQKN